MDGPIKKGKTSFSFNIGGMDSFDTETIRTANPDGTQFDGVVSKPTDRINFNARVEHAINKNQMLRVEYSRNNNDQGQLGVGGFELYERAYDRFVRGNEVRISTSGPVFRKMRNEVRLEVDWNETVSTSFSDARTIRVQDAFTSGGAQVAGGRKSKTIEFADNLDFALGKKHALRAGVLVEGGSYRSDETRNYNGTYTFSSNDAYLAGEALQFSQRIGDPLVEYRSFQFGAYLQDDFRVQKNLLVSYGLRYEAQTHLNDHINLSPRASFAWTPFKSGSTTIRGGFGVFNEWYDDSLYEQALRLDGEHQRDLIVRNPTYPTIDLSGAAQLAPSVTRVAADVVMPQITRASFGVEHAFASWAQFRSNYFIQRTDDEFRAVNLNAPVDSVRPFPALGIITYVDAIGEAKSQGVDLSMNLNYAPKRIFGAVNYRLAKAMNDGDSATSLPMNGGDLAAEWGPTRNDVRHRIFGFVSTPLKFGLRTNVNMRYESGVPYNVTTGFDDNSDDVMQRPAGRRRPQQRPRRGPAEHRPATQLAEEHRPAEGRRPGSGRAGRRARDHPRPGRRARRRGRRTWTGRRRGWRRLRRRLRARRQQRPGQPRDLRAGLEPDQHGELPQLLDGADIDLLRPAALVGRAPSHRAGLPSRVLIVGGGSPQDPPRAALWGAQLRDTARSSGVQGNSPGPRSCFGPSAQAPPTKTALAAAPAVAHNATGSSTPRKELGLPLFAARAARRVCLVVALSLSSAVVAGAAADPVEYRVLATNKTSTMEKEMRDAAAAGFRFGGTMGGDTAFGGNEVVVLMTKAGGAAQRYEYRLLATTKTSTMQRELQEAAAAGFEYRGQSVFTSMFGGKEVVVIWNGTARRPVRPDGSTGCWRRARPRRCSASCRTSALAATSTSA